MGISKECNHERKEEFLGQECPYLQPFHAQRPRGIRKDVMALIRPVVKAKTVLELATGTGLIAKHIVNAAAHIEATDASAEMIAEAKRDNRSAKLHFSVQDMFCLPYADGSSMR